MKNHSRLLNGVFIAASELVSCIALVGAVAVCASASDEEEQLLTTTALVQQQMNDRSKKRKTLEQLTEQPLKKERAKFPYDREAGRKHVKYYFVGEHAILPDRKFQEVFHISRLVFGRVNLILERDNPFFRDGYDCTHTRKICPTAKGLAAMKKLSTGGASSSVYTEFEMGLSTVDKCLKEFCKSVSQSWELRSTYLRPMTKADARRVVARHKEMHGVNGQLGSLDCTHFPWVSCPAALKGQHQSKEKIPTIVMESVADYDLWIWFASIGYAGSNSDMVIWEKSPLHNKLVNGDISELDFRYTIGDDTFELLYFLTDGIYPELSRFVKGYQEPADLDRKRYTKWQESSRKDVERSYGVLKKKFPILKGIRLYDKEEIISMVETCIILHNMMVEERMQSGHVESDKFYVNDNNDEDNEEGGEIVNDDQTDEDEALVQDRNGIEFSWSKNAHVTPNEERNQGVDREVQNGWSHERYDALHDHNEHVRLRLAIVKHLKRMY